MDIHVDILFSYCAIPASGKKAYHIFLMFPGGAIPLHKTIKTKKKAMKLRTKYRNAFRSIPYDDLRGAVHTIAALIQSNVR